MGLAFLNKKSWHTGSFQNIEKVWIAEQKKKEHDRRQAELLKKLKEERHLEEMKKLQVEAGLIPASHLNRMDWMYQGANKMQEKQSEDYLLGKKIEEKDLEKKPQNTFTPLYKEEIGNIKNEEFTKLHEDPLFMIKQEEMKRKKEIIENPIKMKDIYAELEMITNKKKKKSKKDKKEKKAKKEKSKDKEKDKEKEKEKDKEKTTEKEKEEKKHHKKKHHKKEKKHRHDTDSENSSASDSKSKSRSRSRTQSREKDKKKAKSEEPTKQSKFYEEYLKKRLGPILVKDAEGNLKPDFSLYKKKNKSQSDAVSRMTTEEKIEKLNQMKEDAAKFTQEKLKQHHKDYSETQNVKPDFITEMKKDIYTKEKGINDLGDRISTYKNYLTRIKDDSNTFKNK